MTPTLITPKLAQALYECQCEVEAVVKKGKNPHFNSTYAKLEDVIEAVKPALKKSGLFVCQPLASSEKPNHVAIRTILGHFSGEAMELYSEMPVEGSGPQKMISATTYLRRSMLVSLFLLPTEDDDGNAAQAKQELTPSQHIQTAAVKNGWSARDVAQLIHKEYQLASLDQLDRTQQAAVYKCVSTMKPQEAL